MSDKFREMQAEVAKRVNDAVPDCEIYLIVAWDSRYGGWSVRRSKNYEEYSTLEAAEKAAAKLAGQWLNRTIVKIAFGANHQVPTGALAAGQGTSEGQPGA